MLTQTTATLHITQRELHSALSRVKHAISEDAHRYYLDGVFLHVNGGKAHFVATDGHRLACVSVDTEADNSFPAVILPTAFVRAAIKATSKRGYSGHDCPLVVSSTKVALYPYGQAAIEDKPVDGTYPDYARVVPSGNAPHGVYNIPREKFAVAAKALAAYSEGVNKESPPVLELAINTDKMAMHARPGHVKIEFSHAYAVLDIGVISNGKDDNSPAIGFNGKYLVDIARACEGHFLQFHYYDHGGPCRFVCEEDACYVVMPARI